MGKSALVIQYVDNYFVSEYAPSVGTRTPPTHILHASSRGPDHVWCQTDGKFTRLVKLDRQGDKAPVQLDILDPVGLGITATSLPPATATVDGVVIAFDVTSRDSFEACKRTLVAWNAPGEKKNAVEGAGGRRDRHVLPKLFFLPHSTHHAADRSLL